ncbi:hypothetical protein [Xenorhabdus japonica]|uniref:Uncharacterized protein n=1 Tax=Xenorhabdus japonica TaxID=53341 RepID=A0A1I5E2W0_9GAMM|nr:hypothetical protein [Xenorhabdus japonica]SFO05792.1 hypothetical protein SAMN05421579_1529 [Xenorhabdus japonica]
MATTRLSDIFRGDYYQAIAPLNSPEKTAVFESGIISSNIANDGSDMVIEGDKEISANNLIDAAFTAGDAADTFSAIGVHSVVMKQMATKNLIETIRDSEGRVILQTYLGKPLFMDDSLKHTDGRYLTVFFGSGAFGYGSGNPHTPVELDRKASGGNGGGAEVLWERKTFILQPAGFSWLGEEDPNKTPSTTDIAQAVNWQRKFDRKNVLFAAVLSGAPVSGSKGTKGGE